MCTCRCLGYCTVLGTYHEKRNTNSACTCELHDCVHENGKPGPYTSSGAASKAPLLFEPAYAFWVTAKAFRPWLWRSCSLSNIPFMQLLLVSSFSCRVFSLACKDRKTENGKQNTGTKTIAFYIKMETKQKWNPSLHPNKLLTLLAPTVCAVIVSFMCQM